MSEAELKQLLKLAYTDIDYLLKEGFDSNVQECEMDGVKDTIKEIEKVIERENVTRVKYTQGPWEVEPTHIDDPAFISDIHAPHQDNPSENGTDPTVATTWYRSVDGQAEANARLISAAPELFEALKTLMEWEGNEAGSYPDPDTQTEANLAWEKAANAITKAVGIKEYFEEN